MRVPTPLLRALVLGPQLLLSAAIMLVPMALLPPVPTWLVLAAAVVVMSGVAGGVLESWAGFVPDVVVDGLVARATSRAEVDGASAIWMQMATLPYRLVASVVRVPLTRLRSMPLGAMAWRLRGVLLIGVLVPTSSDHGASATGAAVIVVMTYLLPFAERQCGARRDSALASTPRGSAVL